MIGEGLRYIWSRIAETTARQPGLKGVGPGTTVDGANRRLESTQTTLLAGIVALCQRAPDPSGPKSADAEGRLRASPSIQGVGPGARIVPSMGGKETRASLLMVTTNDLGAINGPSIHFLSVANALSLLGHPISIIAPRPSGMFPVPLGQGLQLHLVRNARRARLPGAVAALFMFRRLWQFRHWDVLYLRSAPGTVIVAGAARLLGFRHIVVECNGWFGEEIASFGLPRLLGRIAHWVQVTELRMASHVRAVTANLKSLMVSDGVAADKVSVITNGTDVDTFRPLDRGACRRSLGLSDGVPVLVFLGNLWPAIDLATVFSAMASLRARGVRATMLVAGSGVYQAAFEQSAASILGDNTLVKFLGALTPAEANVVLSAADVAVAPFTRQRNEVTGLAPLKIRDYAAAGVPCVASELGGIVELISEPWMFLAKPGDPRDFADAIQRALAVDRNVVGGQARAYAEAQFSWHVLAQRISELVSTTLARTP